MCKITVFTPTYNRGYIIENLYQSLIKQSFKDFEWIIIDQGTDNTEEKIQTYIKENKLPKIKYYKSSNRKGINRSINDALEIAEGKMFFKVDDDDYLIPEALELINKWECSISGSDKKYAGVSGLRMYQDGTIIGGEWSHLNNYIDATNLERRKYNLLGDKAEVYYTNILREYGPLPEFEGESLTFESILYDKIAYDGFKIRWFGKAIYCTEYLADGQTRTTRKRLTDNLNTYRALLDANLHYKSQPLKHMLKNLCRYSEMCRTKNMNYSRACGNFQHGKFWVFICWYMSIFTKNIKAMGEIEYE